MDDDILGIRLVPVSRDAAYFATLRLAALDTDVKAHPAPGKAAAWEVANPDASPLLRRLDPHARTLLFQGKEPYVKRARPDVEPSQEEPTLAERKRLSDRSLVTRRLLRPLSR